MSKSQPPSKDARVTRVDAAHPIRSKEPVERISMPQPVAKIAAGEIRQDMSEQVRNQASQLARHLRNKQQQIDHREAHLNARIAQLEREVRASRLWCTEREQISNEREQELEKEIRELHQKIQGFSASEVAAHKDLDTQRDELRELNADLESREKTLQTNQSQVIEKAEGLRVASERLDAEREEHESHFAAENQRLAERVSKLATEQRQASSELAKRRASLEEKERQLKEQLHASDDRREQEVAAVSNQQQESIAAAYALLDEQTTALQDEREQFKRQQIVAQEQLQSDRESFDAHRQEAERDFGELRAKLTGRQSTLDQRRASLEQMKQQVLDVHRETIEMRMVTEQLWQQMAKGNSVAELTQPLGQLRAKLVDEFRLSQDEIAEKEQQLRELASKLGGRQQQLKQQRTELNQWLERRNAAIEEQAARLVARELELDEQQQQLREQESAWREERRELQTRLRHSSRQMLPSIA